MIVTKQSMEKRRETFDKYEQRITEAQTDKEEARSQGDLSENFGYVEARNQIENLRRIQSELGLSNPALQVVDPLDWTELDMEDMPRAMVGAKVTFTSDGVQESAVIGGAWDADLDQPNIIPYNSPLGKALIPKQPGFETELPTGQKIKLIHAEVPEKSFLEKLYSQREKTRKKPEQDQGMTM